MGLAGSAETFASASGAFLDEELGLMPAILALERELGLEKESVPGQFDPCPHDDSGQYGDLTPVPVHDGIHVPMIGQIARLEVHVGGTFRTLYGQGAMHLHPFVHC